MTKKRLAFFKFWKNKRKEPDQPPVTLQPSSATAVPDQLAPASNTSQTLPHPEISNPLAASDADSSVLITPDVSAGSPPSASTTQFLASSARLGTSTAAVEYAEVSSRGVESSESSAVSRQDELWNRAYEKLKSKEPDIVDAFEKLLSVKIKDIDALPSEETQNRISTRPQKRWDQMRRVAEAGLKKTERSTNFQERVNNVIQTVSPFKQVIDQVVKVVPQAAVPWVGVSLAFEILSNPFTEPGINRDGLIYIISRMDWYMNLLDSLLDDGSPKLHMNLHRQLEDHTVELYQKLLLYQMKSIYCFYKNSLDRFLRNIVRVDNWSDQLKDIKAAETVVEKDFYAFQNQAKLARLEEQNQEAARRFKMIQSWATQNHDMLKEQENQKCLKHLCQTDPSLDKDRILETKGKLLKTAYYWIIDNPDFKQWRTDRGSRRLWIKGDPGKGKTMLLCGLIKELEEDNCLCYFFCQATEEKLNTANAVLRGLIYHLVQRYPKLISHVRKDYDTRGRMLFEDHNAWQALCKILESILQDDDLHECLIIVDAIDECKDAEDREKLLEFICKISADTRAKLIVSSRNWPEIQKILGRQEEHAMTISLELNEDSISDAVKNYIERKVEDLAQLEPYKSNPDLRRLVQDRLIENSSNTFLWVALVCQELGRSKATNPRRVRQILRDLPADLQGLYSRMIKNISDSADSKLCTEILAVASVVKRPVTCQELFYIISSSLYDDLKLEDMESIIESCGSFLNIQGDTIYFVHQSAVDFLHSDASTLPEIAMRHHSIFWNSLNALLESEHMKRDIYGLEAPATRYEMIKLPHPDPLSDLHYCCIYWVDHLASWIYGGNMISTPHSSTKNDAICKVHTFLRSKFLYWVEGLALHGQMQQAVQAIQKLQSLLDKISDTVGQDLSKLVHDATRFLLYHRAVIATNPFQLYASALCFTPEESVVKQMFQSEAPQWVTMSLVPGANWSACLQTLVDHEEQVKAVAYSKDGKWLLSGSDEGTAKLWDAETGTCMHTLSDHGMEPHRWRSGEYQRAAVRMAAFSTDNQRLVTGSRNGIVKLWNRESGVPMHEIKYEISDAQYLTISPDHRRVAFALSDNTVSICYAEEKCPFLTLKGHMGVVRSMSFSPNGKRLATASEDRTVKIWDLETGKCLRTLDGHDKYLQQAAFSNFNDGQWLASSDSTVRLWKANSGKLVSKFSLKWKYSSGAVRAITFSLKDELLAAASDAYIHVWNINTKTLIWRVRGHEYDINSLAISPDPIRPRLLSASFDKTIKVWDLSMRGSAKVSEENDAPPYLVSFSTDGHQVAAYYKESQTIKVWSKTLASHIAELHCDNNGMSALAFSRDSKLLACASSKGKIIVWNLETVTCMESFGEHKAPDLTECDSRECNSENEDSEEADSEASDSEEIDFEDSYFGAEVTSLAFRDNLQLASSASGVLKIWNISDGTCADTLEISHERIVRITFSEDGQWLAYGMTEDDYHNDCNIKIWNMESKHHCSTSYTAYDLESLSFSADGSLLLSASTGEINIWDLDTASCVWRFEDEEFTGLHVSFDSRYERRLHTELGYMDLMDSKPGYLTRSPPEPDIKEARSTGQDCSRPEDSDLECADLKSDVSTVSEYMGGAFRFSGYGFSRKLDWIVQNGERLLWIPQDYRLDPQMTSDDVTPVIDGSVLTWMNREGKIVRMHFLKE